MRRLLDLFVYAPAGLVETAAEEFERLAEKGRHRVEGQVHTARLVGQFAVQMARSQAQRAFDSAVSRVSGEPPPAAKNVAGARAEEHARAAVDHDHPGTPPAAGGEAAPAAHDVRPDERRAAEAQNSIFESRSAAAPTNGSAGDNSLAIPGYDSLSASQVVQRLDGLSREELEDVKSHELGNRHRRTILNRVDQLLTGAGDHR